jgi:hypothetical protein
MPSDGGVAYLQRLRGRLGEIIAVETFGGGPNWTVCCFNRGLSDAYACDRALQRIVPQYQRIYELAQKH